MTTRPFRNELRSTKWSASVNIVMDDLKCQTAPLTIEHRTYFSPEGLSLSGVDKTFFLILFTLSI